MAVACIALLVALGGTSYATVLNVPRNSVGTPQLKRNAVKPAKLAPNAVRAAHVLNGSLLAADFKGDFHEKNRKAFALGEEWAKERMGDRFRLPRGTFSPRVVMSGNEALAIGAIAGGCKCAAGYPMTPGTASCPCWRTTAHLAGWFSSRPTTR